MNSSTTTQGIPQHDPSLSILKAIGILFVVIAHSGGQSWLVNTAYMFCVPLFFLCSGYLFKYSYLRHASLYLWRRLRGLYLPFWGWSVLFLVLHNFFFWIGILSEKVGNAAGGVLHPYSWHDFCQRVWSVTFNMSGYDEFLSGSYWFFRTLFVSSLAFLGLFILLRKLTGWRNKSAVVLLIVGIAWCLAFWQVGGNLRITGLAQGGYRELIAIGFIGVGYLYRRQERFLPLPWLWAILGFVVFGLFAYFSPSAMVYKANYTQFFSLPLPAIGIFIGLLFLSRLCVQHASLLTRGLVYIGDRTLYIFAFHLLAFKLVSIVKVLVYNLDWAHVGSHTVVHVHPHDYFFLLYILVGVGLPLLVKHFWMKMDASYNLTWWNCLVYTFKGFRWCVVLLYRGIAWILSVCWRSLLNFKRDMSEFWKASNPKDE